MWYYYLTNKNSPTGTSMIKMTGMNSFIYAWSNDLFSIAVYAQIMINLEGDEYYIESIECDNMNEFEDYLLLDNLISTPGIDSLQLLLYEGTHGYQAMTKETILYSELDDYLLYTLFQDYWIEPIITLIVLLERIISTDLLVEVGILKLALHKFYKYTPVANIDFLSKCFNLVGLIDLLYSGDYSVTVSSDTLLSDEFNERVTIL